MKILPEGKEVSRKVIINTFWNLLLRKYIELGNRNMFVKDVQF